MKKLYIIFALIFGFYYLNAQKLVSAEYFFGNDPGIGNATAISINQGDSLNQVFSVSVSSLNQGFNKISFRVKDSLGIWSLTQTKIFYKLPQSALANTTPKVKRIEYFIDYDPGLGNATAINFSNPADSTYQIFSVPLSSLSEGFHNLCVRAQDSSGIWSITQSKVFYKMPLLASAPTTPVITEIEYFFDNDPGFGNGNNLSYTNTGDSAYQIFSVPVSSLSEGFHNLSVRTKDSLGNWSLTQSKVFYVMNSVTALPTSNIKKLEYFFDNDPGPGNGTYLSVNSSDTINQAFSLPMTGLGLDSGIHYFAVRAMDSLNNWSLILSDTFRILGCNSPVANFSCDTSICYGDSLILTNLTSGTDQYINYQWDIDNDGVFDFSSQNDTSYVYSNPGTYQVKLKATNSSIFSFGCVDTLTKTIVVHELPPTNLTVYGSGSICPGSSVPIGVSSGLGYSYQWFKDGSALPNTNAAIYNAVSNGDYSVEVTNFEGCKDTSLIETVSMYSIPIANITTSGPSSFCAGDSVSLTASSGINLNYQWYKNGIVLTNDTLQNITINSPGSYKVQISNSDGCVNESSPEIITVNPLPIVNLFALSSTAFCMGDSVILQTNQASNYSYNWFKDNTLLTNDTTYQLVIDSTANVYVELIDQNSCAATSSSISIISYDIPTSDFTVDSNVCASDTISIDYLGSASSSAFYNWDFDGATVLSGTGQGPYGVKWNTAGNKQISLVVSENGCASVISNSIVNVNAISAVISSANTSVCDGDSIFITANSGPDFTYQWLQAGVTMSGETSSFLNISSTGNYQVIITDTAIGCSQVSNSVLANVFTNDFNLSFSGNTTSFSQPPFDVSFTNSTPNMSDYQFEWDFGDGNTSNFYQPFHSYQYNGDYSVQLYAENVATACKDTLIKTDFISCTGGVPNPCNIVAAVSPAGPATICNGDSVMISASAGTGYSYQWARNGLILTGEDSIVIWAKQAGNYRVIITDSICSQTSPPFVLNHYPSIQPQILVNGSIQPCTDDSLELYLPTSYINYNWNTGDTFPNTFVSQTGYYTVSVTDHYGCNMTSQPETVNASFLSPPEVCIVGVDSNYNNRIIWERPVNDLIDSIYVYRESVVAGQYSIIGALDYDDFGLFSDTNSNPAIRSYRYRLAALDTCGAITLMSTYHKTIHLTINAGLNGSWNLIWDGYSGFPFGSYRIYRGTSTSNMSLLTQLPSTSTSYTDLNPPSGTVYYQIEVVKASGCYPDSTFTKANTNYNSSRSNVANNGSIAPIYLMADFNANVSTGQWPIQVSFNDLSTGNPTSWIWNFGDGNTSVERNPQHTYNNTGLYDVQLIACNSGICDTTIKQDYINVLPNGIVEIDVELSAKIYPNPNDGSFTLEINSKKSKDAMVYIYNNIGQMIYSEEFNINSHTYKKLDLSSQAKGIYHVHLSTDKGVVYREKVVVK